jgi:hypothetical protein
MLVERGHVPIEVVASSMGKLDKFCLKNNVALKLNGEIVGCDQEVVFEAMRWSKEKQEQQP